MPIHGSVEMVTGWKKKVITTVTIVAVGLIAFFIGLYYSTVKFENQIQVWDSNYQIITDKVYAFEEVSDPETIRHYVKELHKILDDITFLGKIVESGQTSAASLDFYFKEYEDKLDEANNMILGLHDKLTELDYKFKEQVTRLTGETDDNLLAIQGLQDVTSLQNKLSDIQDTQIKMIEDDMDSLEAKLSRAKETFIGKHVFK